MMASTTATGLGAKTFSRAWSPRILAPKNFLKTAARLSTTTAAVAAPPKKNFAFAQGLAGGVVLMGLHSATGSQNEFFDYRFKTNKAAEDLATFYGSEDFMELYCVMPFVGTIMMRNGEFDEKGDVLTTGFPGTLKVSMVFSDDTNGDEIEWFNKRERFRDTVFGYTMWDQVSNFGFRTLEDGTLECYHYGEYFHGNIPIISQLLLSVFKIHARWLAWSTEHHINHYAFTANTEEEEEWEEESRKNMPIFLLKYFFLVDLRAMIFGVKEEDEQVHHEKSPSFLVRRGSSEDSEELPIQRKGTMLQISQDIASDRAAVKATLARAATQSGEEAKEVLARTYTLKSEDGATAAAKATRAYSAATEAARSHHIARRGSIRDLSSSLDGTGSAKAERKTTKTTKKNTSEEAQALHRWSSAIGS